MRVIEPDHVVAESDHSLASEADAPRRDAAFGIIRHAPILPMAVRIENGGERSFAVAERPVQISRQIKSRNRFEVNFFDAVALAIDFVENDRMNRPALRHRPEAATDENLFPNVARPSLPFAARGDVRELAGRIESANGGAFGGAGGRG